MNGWVRAPATRPALLGGGAATALLAFGAVAALGAGETTVASTGMSWSAPTSISPAEGGPPQPAAAPGAAPVEPAIAIDARGDAVAVWKSRNGIRAAARRAGGGWRAPVTIVKANANPPSTPGVAIDPQGNAVAIWQRAAANGSEEIQTASMDPGGSWRAPVRLSDDAEHQERLLIALDARGRAIALWTQPSASGAEATVKAAFRPAGGSWQRAETISAPSEASGMASVSDLAVSASGAAVAIWLLQSTDSAGITDTVQSALRPAGGGWQRPVGVGVAPGGADLPSVAIDSGGAAVAVWEGLTKDNATQIQSALGTPAAGWQPMQALFPAAPNENAFAPQVAMDAHGDAIAAGVGSSGAHDTIRACLRPAGGAWQAPVTLFTAQGSYVPAPRLATDSRGDSVVVWASYAGSGDRAVIESALRPAGGSWRSPVRIASASVQRFNPSEHGVIETFIPAPQVAIDRSGEAVAIWFDYSHGRDVVRVAHLNLRAAEGKRHAANLPTRQGAT